MEMLKLELLLLLLLLFKIDWLDQSNRPTFFLNFSLGTVSNS